FDALQGFNHEEVSRNIEWINARIIRRAETRMNKPDRTARIAVSIFTQSVVGRKCFALEGIRTSRSHTLLRLECLDDSAHPARPALAKWFWVARDSPIFVREPHRVAKGINLPLALA